DLDRARAGQRLDVADVVDRRGNLRGRLVLWGKELGVTLRKRPPARTPMLLHQPLAQPVVPRARVLGDRPLDLFDADRPRQRWRGIRLVGEQPVEAMLARRPAWVGRTADDDDIHARGAMDGGLDGRADHGEPSLRIDGCPRRGVEVARGDLLRALGNAHDAERGGGVELQTGLLAITGRPVATVAEKDEVAFAEPNQELVDLVGVDRSRRPRVDFVAHLLEAVAHPAVVL